jgi:hypothetical protein
MAEAHELSTAEAMTLVAIADNAGVGHFSCHPGQEFLCRRTRLSERNLRRCIDTLVEKGLMFVQARRDARGRRILDLYRLPVRVDAQVSLEEPEWSPWDIGPPDTVAGGDRPPAKTTGQIEQPPCTPHKEEPKEEPEDPRPQASRPFLPVSKTAQAGPGRPPKSARFAKNKGREQTQRFEKKTFRSPEEILKDFPGAAEWLRTVPASFEWNVRRLTEAAEAMRDIGPTPELLAILTNDLRQRTRVWLRDIERQYWPSIERYLGEKTWLQALPKERAVV